MLKQVTIIGAGANGAGCLGLRAHAAGYHVVFLETYSPFAEFVRDGYTVKSVGLDHSTDLLVNDVEAYLVGTAPDEAVVNAVLRSEAVFFAAGRAYHPLYAPLIRRALQVFLATDTGTKNLIFCENQPHSGRLFRDQFLSDLFANYPDAAERIGLVDTVIHIMSRREEDILLSEDYADIPFDADAVRGSMPSIPHLRPYSAFSRMDQRKLFTHNLLHAAIGYPAYARRIASVTEAGTHTDVTDLAVRATDESIRGLAGEYAAKYPEFAVTALADLRDEMLTRTLNPLFDDKVTRLTRAPIRKLAPNERMVGAALLAEKHGVKPTNIATVIAYALQYDDPQDPESVELQQRLHEDGLGYCLREICSVGPRTITYQLVEGHLRAMFS